VLRLYVIFLLWIATQLWAREMHHLLVSEHGRTAYLAARVVGCLCAQVAVFAVVLILAKRVGVVRFAPM